MRVPVHPAPPKRKSYRREIDRLKVAELSCIAGLGGELPTNIARDVFIQGRRRLQFLNWLALSCFISLPLTG